MPKEENATRSTGTTLSFDGARTLANAEDVRTSLISALQVSNLIVLECDALCDVDLSFIQCLVAARRSAEEQGKSLTLAAPAAGSLRDALLRGGFLSTSDSGPRHDETFWTKGSGVA